MPFGRLCLDLDNWICIFWSPTMVQDFDREVSRIMERFVPMVTVKRRGGDAAWFDGDCRRAFGLKESDYHCWCRNCSAVNWEHEEWQRDSMLLRTLVTLLTGVRILKAEAELLTAWFNNKQSRCYCNFTGSCSYLYLIKSLYT